MDEVFEYCFIHSSKLLWSAARSFFFSPIQLAQKQAGVKLTGTGVTPLLLDTSHNLMLPRPSTHVVQTGVCVQPTFSLEQRISSSLCLGWEGYEKKKAWSLKGQAP